MRALTTGIAAALLALVMARGADAPKDGAAGNATTATTAETRAAFLKLIDRPKVATAFAIQNTTVTDGVEHAHFTFLAAANETVPGIWAKPAKTAGRLPVVIMLHGTGGKKEDFRAQLDTYAQAGFFALAIDGPYHGERMTPGSAKGANYQAAILQSWRTGQGHPFFYDSVWDVMRLVDYLQTRDDVDPKRIGLMGVSKGGIETYLVAAADSRIAAAVPFIGMESFAWALDHEVWSHRTETIQQAVDGAAKDAGTKVDAVFVRKFYDKVAPGIYGQFDGPAMAALIAPRPLLMVNGELDPRTPRAGIDLCIASAQPIYHAASADDQLKLYIEPKTPHKVTPAGYAAALAWFKEWLKPGTGK
jgi:dienelactone hydrolase